MELKAYLHILRRRWWIVLVAFTIVLVATGVLTSTRTPTYRSTATFIVAPKRLSFEDQRSFLTGLDTLSRNTEIAATCVEVARSQMIKREAADALGLSNDQRRSLTVDSRLLAGTAVIELTVDGTDPSTTQSFAASVGERTTAYMEELYEAYYFDPLDPPSLPRSPVKPNTKLNLALGAVFGLALGMGLAFFAEYWQGPVPAFAERGTVPSLAESVSAERHGVSAPALPKAEEVTESVGPASAGLAHPPYSSRITKAGALSAETKALLKQWDPQLSLDENLRRVEEANIFGKATTERLEHILLVLRERYFADPDVGMALVTLGRGDGKSAQWMDPLLYFFSAQNDHVLRDAVVKVLYPALAAQQGHPLHLSSDEQLELLVAALHNWTAEGKTPAPWGDYTIRRVAQSVIGALHDFGVLTESTSEREVGQSQLEPARLPLPAFALTALWLQGRAQSGNSVLHSDDWKLFFLPDEGVERLFREAHQEHLLTYQAVGSAVQIKFQATSLTEYAHVLLGKAR